MIFNVSLVFCVKLWDKITGSFFFFFILLGDFETWLYVKEPGEPIGPKVEFPKLRPITFI